MIERTAQAPGDSLGVRAVGIGLLAGIVLIHLQDVRSKFEETRYLGVGYVLLIAACVVAAALLVQRRRRWRDIGWLLAGGGAALTLLGFVLTRTVGLPQATDDEGDWRETLGVWSMISETLMILLAGFVLATVRGRRRATA